MSLALEASKSNYENLHAAKVREADIFKSQENEYLAEICSLKKVLSDTLQTFEREKQEREEFWKKELVNGVKALGEEMNDFVKSVLGS